MIDISIIIPIYNAEPYIKDCINSVIRQSIKAEIILVDDGSTDNSLKMINKFIENYDNIILIKQSHAGPSAARNRGLAIAKGKYTAFVDSDDTIYKHSLKRLYRKAIKHDADIVMGKIYYLNRSNVLCLSNPPEYIKNKIITGHYCFITSMSHKSYMPMACNSIYKTSWINSNSLKFKDGILYEDELWTLEAFTNSSRVLVSNTNYYMYYKRKDSITNSPIDKFKLDSIFNICRIIEEQHELFNSDLNKNRLKEWLIVNTLRLYYNAFQRMYYLDDYNIPSNKLHLYTNLIKKMEPDISKYAQQYIKLINKISIFIRQHEKTKL